MLALGIVSSTIAAMLLLQPTLAAAHTIPGALPPVPPDYDVRWFQNPDTHDIQDWDIEITPFESGYAQRIVQAQPFPDDRSCWIATVPADGPARVRIRAVQDGVVSVWSGYTTVPEPGFGVALTLGGLFLACLRNPHGRSSFRPPRHT
jgi:hypothetical protein